MLPWQQRIRLRKRTLFLWKIVALTSFFHAILLVAVLLLCGRRRVDFNINISKAALRGQTVILMPLCKKVPGAQAKLVAQSKAKKGASGGLNVIRKRKAVLAKKSKPAPSKIAKKAEPLPVQKKTTIATKKKIQKPKPQAKVQKLEPQKPKLEEKPKEIPKVEPKAVEKKKPEVVDKAKSKVEEPVKKVEPVTPKPEPVVNEKPTNEVVAQGPATSEGVVPEGVLVGQDDLAALEMQQLVYEAVSKHWKPPVGMPDDLSCKIRVSILPDGGVHSSVVEEKSGVLVYDMSARSALSHVSFPRQVHGKEVVLTFRR